MKRQINQLALAVALAAGCSIGTANAALEVENNDTVSAAQTVAADANGEIHISAWLGAPNTDPNGDVDFYRFFGQAGDVVSIDIDYGDGGQQAVNIIAALFMQAPRHQLMWQDYISRMALDPGSSSRWDPYLPRMRLPLTGDYTVGISNYPRFMYSGGNVRPGPAVNGDYELIITGLTPPVNEVLDINIDIKPGAEIAPLNPKSKGKIPVALLSASDFNALNVDPASLTFGPTGDEQSLHKCNTTGEDVNSDGLLDLVCHFNNRAAGFQNGDMTGKLRGRLKAQSGPSVLSATALSGKKIEGVGFIKSFPKVD